MYFLLYSQRGSRFIPGSREGKTRVNEQEQSTYLRCEDKYSRDFDSDLNFQPKVDRVFIAALLHNNEDIVTEWSSGVLSLARAFPRAYVSVYESGSSDKTPSELSKLRKKLTLNGLQNTIITGDLGASLGGIPFIPGDANSGNRIAYLARLRNLVLQPLLDQKVKGITYDKVIFLNDVLFCVEDILRLSSHEADISCGYDFNGPTFWDNWVMDYGSTDPIQHACVRDSNFQPTLACNNSSPLPVACCWNGAAVFEAAIIYAGVRFRRGRKGAECSDSECSIFCRDARAEGFGRVVVDPTVQVAYNKEFPQFRRALPKQMLSLKAQDVSSFEVPAEINCCELLHDGQQYVDWDKCFKTNI